MVKATKGRKHWRLVMSRSVADASTNFIKASCAQFSGKSVLHGMNENQAIILSMAMRQLPGRVKVEDASKLLGFTDDDFTILMGDQRLKLKPLGNPARNAPKMFAATRLLELAANPDWLDQASNAVRRHHQKKRLSASTHASRKSLAANDEHTMGMETEPGN